MSQITSHVLDTTRGQPVENLAISLFEQTQQGWRELATGVTNADGRISDLLTAKHVLSAGVYRMHFATQAYFISQKVTGFYPYVDIVFEIDASGAHYHIPLLLTAFGYSTYRGS
ncbi:5-hydroxyisourate hydrolase [Colwellia chukchiensis]|uniref:5-hydroxyisourate hydrolase n=1 Tax=Colwellia chukchiensis TaxID=641665 RepID=A0A1H7NYB8_9GAMM|nr:hydroxyisourate hydrolase [Colwellia chukchiensis]SEL28008.1 5-hydroxyisourate hydrolase [Colwellia chukchiensis]